MAHAKVEESVFQIETRQELDGTKTVRLLRLLRTRVIFVNQNTVDDLNVFLAWLCCVVSCFFSNFFYAV